MTKNQYETDEGIIKVTKYEVKESFTNGFAQRVLKLEDGRTIYINYSETEITVEEIVK